MLTDCAGVLLFFPDDGVGCAASAWHLQLSAGLCQPAFLFLCQCGHSNTLLDA